MIPKPRASLPSQLHLMPMKQVSTVNAWSKIKTRRLKGTSWSLTRLTTLIYMKKTCFCTKKNGSTSYLWSSKSKIKEFKRTGWKMHTTKGWPRKNYCNSISKLTTCLSKEGSTCWKTWCLVFWRTWGPRASTRPRTHCARRCSGKHSTITPAPWTKWYSWTTWLKPPTRCFTRRWQSLNQRGSFNPRRLLRCLPAMSSSECHLCPKTERKPKTKAKWKRGSHSTNLKIGPKKWSYIPSKSKTKWCKPWSKLRSYVKIWNATAFTLTIMTKYSQSTSSYRCTRTTYPPWRTWRAKPWRTTSKAQSRMAWEM